MKYLDENGLLYVVQKIKNWLSAKAESAHTHKMADITDYTGIDSVEWSDVKNKPTDLQDFTNNAGYIKEEFVTSKGYQNASQVEEAINSKISSVMTYKGTVANYTDLPTNASMGDTYNITNSSEYNEAGDNAAWNGTGWDVLSGTINLSGYVQNKDLTAITNTEIDTICA